MFHILLYFLVTEVNRRKSEVDLLTAAGGQLLLMLSLLLYFVLLPHTAALVSAIERFCKLHHDHTCDETA